MSMKTKLTILLLLFGTVAQATLRVASQTGNWSNPATWGGVAPAIGDTGSVQDSVSLTCDTTCIIGAWGATGSVALSLNSTGKLIIATGADYQPRGDTVYTAAACGNLTDAVVMNAGSAWHFDSSGATSPSTTHYVFRSDATNGCRNVNIKGTKTSRAVISTMAGSASGKFADVSGSTHSGTFTATFADFSNIGDATVNGWEITTYGNTPFSWDVTDSTFTNCGTIANIDPVAGGISATAVFRHNRNVHSGSLGATIFSHWPITIGMDAGGGGLRELRDNVFDIMFNSNSDFYPLDFKVLGNYFGDKPDWGPGRWAAFKGNLVHCHAGNPYLMVTQGDEQRNYYLLDEPLVVNPHGVNPSLALGGQTMDGSVFEHAGNIQTSESALGSTPSEAASGIYTYKNLIVLPNEAGGSSYWLGVSITGAHQPLTLVYEHNTVYADNNTGGVGFVTWHPTTPTTMTGMVTSFKSNIFWALTWAKRTYKAWSFCSEMTDPAQIANCTANLNPFLPTSADYNAGWNTKRTLDPADVQYTNGGNGYAEYFSSTPGQHDLDTLLNDSQTATNPNYVDSRRNIATWDTLYLHHTATAWNPAAGTGVYNVGDTVSNADATIWAGQTINYRYVNGSWTSAEGTDIGTTVCAGQNPKPGDYTRLARACWEWASLYNIRLAKAAGTIYDDPANGITAADANIAVLQWVTSGFAPRNLAYAGAAHDGTDIGAVPVVLPNPQSNSPIQMLPAVIRRLFGRGVIVRGGTQ